MSRYTRCREVKHIFEKKTQQNYNLPLFNISFEPKQIFGSRDSCLSTNLGILLTVRFLFCVCCRSLENITVLPVGYKLAIELNF